MGRVHIQSPTSHQSLHASHLPTGQGTLASPWPVVCGWIETRKGKRKEMRLDEGMKERKGGVCVNVAVIASSDMMQ